MWLDITGRVLCVIALLLSGGTTLSLSRFIGAEEDRRKKEVMGLGLLMSLILFMIMFYKVVFI